MTCDSCQEALALQDRETAVAASIAKHLAECRTCRVVQAELARIEATLADGPVWTPPTHFAQRTAWLAVAEMAAPVELYGVTPATVERATAAAMLVAAAWVVVRLAGDVVAPMVVQSPAVATVSAALITIPYSLWVRRRLAM